MWLKMLLQLLALVVVYIISLSHYGAGKAVLLTVFIGVTALVMYFVFSMVAIMILSVPVNAISSLKAKGQKDDKSSSENLLKSLKNTSSGKYEWRLPFCAIVGVALAALIFNLLHTSDFIRALFYLTFALYAILSYLDKLFTHLPNRFVPTVLEVSIYSTVAISLFNIK